VPLIHANGIELHYHLQGKGTPIVFLHPPCIASRVFTYLRNDLSQDHKTLLFDFRGMGEVRLPGFQSRFRFLWRILNSLWMY
jgi:pimeloyl-ACP methyl ester carboxylesterase